MYIPEFIYSCFP